jgi:hypothetical protein
MVFKGQRLAIPSKQCLSLGDRGISFSLSRAVFERGPDRPEAYPTRVHRLWSPRLRHYPSNSEYSVAQLRMMVREVEQIISRQIGPEEWNHLR